MNLLVDTRVCIWCADKPEKLYCASLSALEDEANELFLSVASLWEMQIKIQLGKLKLSLPLKELIRLASRRCEDSQSRHLQTRNRRKRAGFSSFHS